MLVVVTGLPLAARGRDEKGGKKFDENGSLRKAIRSAVFSENRMGRESENYYREMGEYSRAMGASVRASCGYPVKVHTFDLLLEERSNTVDDFVE